MNAPFLPRHDLPLALPAPGDREADLPASAIRVGYVALALFLAAFTLWAALAPLQSAAIASGLLRAEGGGRRVVQHLEGGILRRLLVQEGSQVRAGQVLAELDDTASAAQNAALQADYDTLLAQDARLTATRTGSGVVAYPQELLARRADPRVAEILRTSDRLFDAERQSMRDQVAILVERASQGRADLSSTAPQLEALGDQQRSLDEEIGSVQALVNENLERRSRLLTLQRQDADLAAQRSRLVSTADKMHDVIGETRAQMAFVRGQRLTEAATQQREVQASLAEAREKLSVSRDITQRRLIRAPVTGTVTNLRLVTPGGVLGAGEPLLDVVPSDVETVVVARVKATDIDVVQPGLEAQVRLTPYKTRAIPMLRGTVRKVSADAIADEKSGTLYYEAEIVLRREDLRQVQSIRLVSGMPAEVFIQLGSRSLMQYLLQPLADSFRRAFRED